MVARSTSSPSRKWTEMPRHTLRCTCGPLRRTADPVSRGEGSKGKTAAADQGRKARYSVGVVRGRPDADPHAAAEAARVRTRSGQLPGGQPRPARLELPGRRRGDRGRLVARGAVRSNSPVRCWATADLGRAQVECTRSTRRRTSHRCGRRQRLCRGGRRASPGRQHGNSEPDTPGRAGFASRGLWSPTRTSGDAHRQISRSRRLASEQPSRGGAGGSSCSLRSRGRSRRLTCAGSYSAPDHGFLPVGLVPLPRGSAMGCEEVREHGKSSQDSNNLYQLVNLFSGGALLNISVFALGIMPYITANIIVQLLTVVIRGSRPSSRRAVRDAKLTSTPGTSPAASRCCSRPPWSRWRGQEPGTAPRRSCPTRAGPRS